MNKTHLQKTRAGFLLIHSDRELNEKHVHAVEVHLCENECEVEFDIVLTPRKDIMVMFDDSNLTAKKKALLIETAEHSAKYAMLEFDLACKTTWLE